MSAVARTLLPLAVALPLSLACTDGGDDTGAGGDTGSEARDYSVYTPFDEANWANQFARLALHADIVTLRENVTLDDNAEQFAAIGALYEQESLSEKVAGRGDDHLEVEGWGFADGQAEIGAFLDAQIDAAIALGATTEDANELAWAGQVADKGLLVFFYYSVYHELFLRQRANLDEAFGYSGLEPDGTPWAALASKAEGRESEFGLSIVDPMFRAFIDARYEMADGTADNDAVLGANTDYDAAWAEVDRQLLRTLGWYAVHEIAGADETNLTIKLIETRIVWEPVGWWLADHDPTAAADIEAMLYPTGRPAWTADDHYMVDLAGVVDGSVTVDAAAIRDAMGNALQGLE